MARQNKYYQGPVSDHFDGVQFFNPGDPDTDRSLSDILRWKLGQRPARWPVSAIARQVVPDRRVIGLRVTVVGHATLLIQTDGLNVLTDPVWSERASPFRAAGPRRVTQPGIAFQDLPPIDVVLLSHNHYDHLDIPTLVELQSAHRPTIVTPLGNDTVLLRVMPDARVITGDWGDRIELGAGAEVHVVPANHWSARGPHDRRMALWAGFLLRTSAGLVYFAGDTGYGDGTIFRAMRERYGPPDLALLPIGAYSPRWFMAAQHTDPEEAVKIMLDLDAGRALGIHWDCFQLTDEAREEPSVLLARALRERGIDSRRFPAVVAGDVFDPRGFE